MRETAANVEMQGIEFQIINDSDEAASGLDRLAQSLANLKTSLGGSCGAMEKLANNIAAMNAALAGIDTSNIEKIGEAMKPLSELGNQQLGSYITQLKKLPEVMSQLDSLDMSRLTDQMQQLANAMKPLADEMQKISNGFSAFPSRIQRLITSSEKYNNAVRRSTTATSGWSRALKKISFAVITRSIAKFVESAIERSSKYTETMNMFSVSLGEYAEAAYEYAEKVSNVMGIDPQVWLEGQGIFNSIVTGFGIAGDKAAFMSKNLNQLAYDLSSFYDIDISAAMQKVQSGISGELEPLRRLGYDLSVARLEQERLNLGINKSVSEMNQAEKAQLRYYAMMTQVTQVQGDMARTLDQPANQLRIFKSQLEQVSRAVGDLFIPALNKILAPAIAVTRVVREMIEAIADLLGISVGAGVEWGAGEDATAGIAENLAEAADSARKTKSYLMGIDELNVISPNNSDATGSSGSSFDIELPGYDFIEGAVTQRIDEIREQLQPLLDDFKESLEAIREPVNWIRDNFEEILFVVGLIGGGLAAWKIAPVLVSAVGGFLAKLASFAGVVALAGILATRLVSLYKNNETFRVGLERAWEFAKMLFGGLGEIFGGLLDGIKEVGSALGGVGSLTDELFEGSSLDLADLILTIAGFAALLLPGGKVVGAVILGFEAITLAVRAFGGLSEEEFNHILEVGKNIFKILGEFVKNVFVGMIEFLGGAFTGNWELVFDGLGRAAGSVFDTIGKISEQLFGVDIIALLKNGLNAAIGLFNRFADLVNEKMNLYWDDITIAGKVIVPAGSVQLISIPHIPQFAEGGFPEMGELFIANEAGAEMVGRIGNRTAVVNNDQIIGGIKSGVREANDEQNALLREQNELLRAILAKETGVKLDGKTLLRSTEKAARHRGTVIMAGGVMG